MSKQNVHQNITGKVIQRVITYTKKYMPDEYKLYFSKKDKENRDEEKNKLEDQGPQL